MKSKNTERNKLKNPKGKKSNKGITLIALIITIVVLLILAGVSIATLTGDNGVLTKAADAKNENTKSSIIDQAKLDVIEWQTEQLSQGNSGAVTDEIIKTQILNGKSYVKTLNETSFITLEGEYEISYSELYKKTSNNPPATVTLESAKAESMLNNSDNTPIEVLVEEGGTEKATFVLPGGFKVAQDSGETINTGIVITDGESEFVWVPVNEINRMVICKSKTADSQCDIDFKDANKTELVCKNHDNSEDICGKLYATSTGENFNKDLDAQTYSETSEFREPALISPYDSDTAMNSDVYGNALTTSYLGTIGLTADTFQDEIDDTFKEMALSVALNGGFYVGRYELSLSDDGYALSKANSRALTSFRKKTTKIGDVDYETNYRWYGLYDIGKKYVNSKNKVKSSMIWGCQYDAMMLWMIDSGLETNVTSPTIPNSGEANTDETTGSEGDTDLINNVYDLYGGNYECTLEVNADDNRTQRGGCSLDYWVSPSFRTGASPDNKHSLEGSRCTLYIQ